MRHKEFLIGLRRRLRFKFGGDDIEHRLEMRPDAEPLQNLVGMVGRAVGQDQFAPGKFGDRRAHRRVRLQWRMIDLMHIGEIIVGAHAVLGHHAAHGGAIAAVVVFLDPARFLRRNLEPGGDELADPHIDLLPQVDVMRIKRVVEIEHPSVDIGEGAGGFFHRLTNPQPSSLHAPDVCMP